MTIFDKVAAVLAEDRDVETTYRNLSPGDRSVLALPLLLAGDMEKAMVKIHTSKPPRPKPSRPAAPAADSA